MTSRERFRLALEHRQPDRPPIDLGATWVTGIAASAYAHLRAALGLPPEPPKINEPYQLLAQVDEEVCQALGVDVVGLWAPSTIFGFRNVGWKPWALQDGTPVLVSTQFETITDANGDILIYPKGDRSAQPSGRLPKGGFYFDAIVRQEPIDEDNLDPGDWADSFGLYDDADLAHFERESRRIAEETDYGLIMNFGGGGIGDIAFVPGQNLLRPRGVRDPQFWYECLAAHEDYIRGIFEIQTEIALKNMELLRQAAGDRLDAIILSGTDFGSQNTLMVSREMFRRLWKPFYTQMNAWVHKHTGWKVFYHTDGAIFDLLDDFVEMGVDILNPVQCSAAGMEPERVKSRYADKLVFWGAGVDTQHTLPLGTPAEVRAQVAERCRIFGRSGGFVFNTIHNIQTNTPPENLIAMYETVRGEPIRRAAACKPRVSCIP